MAVKTSSEIIAAVKAMIGEDTSDESISLIEDVTDTFSDYNTRLSDETNWKKKYEENDESWRKRYMERFSGTSGEEIKEEQEEQVKEDGEPRTFKELFSEREG